MFHCKGSRRLRWSSDAASGYRHCGNWFSTVYMAPEYLTGGRVSDKIDAYGFGVVWICSTALISKGSRR